ncbi:MAG: hypothetical protein WBM57_15220 [Woeseiaceae bacterium]
MRYVVGFLCVCALGALPLVGCGGEADACADWAGDWIVSSVSCDGVAEELASVEFALAADCTGEMILTQNTTCQSTMQMTFMAAAGDATIVDAGTITCSPGCGGECEATDDGGQPFAATISASANTWTLTTLTTAQMFSDELSLCQIGQTYVVVAVPK